MWYKASIVAASGISSYLRLLIVFYEGHFSSLPHRWSVVRRSLCWIYIPGRLAKMLVDRSIEVNLQGYTSPTVTNLANSAKIERFSSSPSISRWSGISWSVWPVLLRTRMLLTWQGLSSSTYMGLSFQKWKILLTTRESGTLQSGVKNVFQGKGGKKSWAPVQSPAVRIYRPLDILGWSHLGRWLPYPPESAGWGNTIKSPSSWS